MNKTEPTAIPEDNQTWKAAAAIFGTGYLGLRLYWLFHRYIMVDETEHLHAAWSMAQGQVLYKDFFEHHGPILYWILQPIVRLIHDPIDALWTGRALMAIFWFVIVYLYARIQPGEWRRKERFVAIVVLCSFSTFARFSLEIRPDVPATALLMSAAFALTRTELKRWFLAGVCIGFGVLCSPKVIFPASGLLVGSLILVWQSNRWLGRSVNLLGTFCFGALVSISGTAIILELTGSLPSFCEWFLGFNARLLPGPYDASFYLFYSLKENIALWSLATWGLITVGRKSLPWSTALLGGLLGLCYVKPVPLGQYYLLIAPFLAWFASERLVSLLRNAKKDTDSLGLAIGALAALGMGFYVQIHGVLDNAEQIGRIRCVMEQTKPTDHVLTFWSGDSIFRLHPTFYCWLCPDIEQTLGAAKVEKEILTLLTGPNCQAVIWDENYLRSHPVVSRMILQNYRHASCGRLFLKRTRRLFTVL